MLWDEIEVEEEEEEAAEEQDIPVDFDFLSLLSKPKDHYKILEVGYDATEDAIRSNYIRLALKWHPDKRKGEDKATSRFQEINEAYQVLIDPVKRREYDRKGILYIPDYNANEYLNRYKGLILTCNGLGGRITQDDKTDNGTSIPYLPNPEIPITKPIIERVALRRRQTDESSSSNPEGQSSS